MAVGDCLTSRGTVLAHDDHSPNRIAVPGGAEAVSDLAVRVLSVLNARQVFVEKNPKQYVRDLLHKRITSPYSFDPVAVLDELHALKINIDTVIDDYIPDSALRIGTDWEQDLLDFAQVTIAALRLQALLNEAAYSSEAINGYAAQCFSALIVSTEHEQHALGGFVVAAQLRRKGASVEVMCAENSDSIVDAIHEGDFDVVMFSCSSMQALASVKEIAFRAREPEIRIPMLALGGLIVTRTRIAPTDYYVDVVTNEIDRIISYFDKKSANLPAAKK